MRHNKSGRRLGRTTPHRKALFRNMAKSLVTFERIKTTEQKAKELRKVADKLVTLAIRGDVHSRRLAFDVLGSHQLVKKLFDEIGPRFERKGGGYTRIVKLAEPRKGDCASMAMIEFSLLTGETFAPKAEKKAAPTTAPTTAPVAEEKVEAAPAEAPAEAEEAPAQQAAAEASAEASGEAPAEESSEAPAQEASQPEADADKK